MKYSKVFLINLYKEMLRIRLCEDALISPIFNKEVRCPVHLYSGQEASAVGISVNLLRQDYCFGTHRSHGHYLAKGSSMGRLIAEIYGKIGGCSHGRGGSMHLYDPENGFLGAAPIVAGTISLALGAALASKVRGDKRVTVSFFGDGAVGEGVLFESLNFAALKKLPIIFACENNLYSTHMPIKECHPYASVANIGLPFGIKTFKVDGNDVLKVYETAKQAVSLCRCGKGPVFLELLTYRLHGHVGPDDNIQGTHTDIRSKQEIEGWKKKDPIKNYKKFLIRRKLSTLQGLSKIEVMVEKEVKTAFAFSKSSRYPKTGELKKYVFKK